MSNFKTLASVILALVGLGFNPAIAGQQTLEFKLVTTRIDGKEVKYDQVEGQSVGVSKAFGVASFKDGRIATKDFVPSWDLNKGSGPFFGYSTYYFEDGSSLTMRYSGNQRAGQPLHGDYVILSGTGAFANATGTGTFDGVVPNKLPGSAQYTGKFVINTP